MAFFSFLKAQTPASSSSNRGRVKFFLSFVAISSLFWVMTKLSNTYTATVMVPVSFEDVPEYIVLQQGANTPLELTLTTSGFQLLWYRFTAPQMRLALQPEVFDTTNKKTTLLLRNYNNAIQEQIGGSSTLVNLQPSSYSLQYDVLERKKVAVLPNPLVFELGYSLTAPLEITPDSVEIAGPATVLDSIEGIEYQWKEMPKLNADFKVNLRLVAPDQVNLAQQLVVLRGRVSRFTEKSFTVPIVTRFEDKTTSIKLFPRQLEVICSLPLEEAAQITAEQFLFEVAYNDSLYSDSSTLQVKMTKFPPQAKNIRWQPKTVQYLLRK